MAMSLGKPEAQAGRQAGRQEQGRARRRCIGLCKAPGKAAGPTLMTRALPESRQEVRGLITLWKG